MQDTVTRDEGEMPKKKKKKKACVDKPEKKRPDRTVQGAGPSRITNGAASREATASATPGGSNAERRTTSAVPRAVNSVFGNSSGDLFGRGGAIIGAKKRKPADRQGSSQPAHQSQPATEPPPAVTVGAHVTIQGLKVSLCWIDDTNWCVVRWY